ncbi:MAG: penicillin-binding protein activator [Sphingomonas bacterium]|uniref:penicillin-binding protein activator n=1 Tax=Sphingomonas bacterium TaxID=1895847 RepID=UPI00260428AC|nr:penicillin-binding protein activator [Sphingomonas bacterium]MDB5696544.1 penicillin-binding protein activator [Sphingomonas bacterium]
MAEGVRVRQVGRTKRIVAQIGLGLAAMALGACSTVVPRAPIERVAEAPRIERPRDIEPQVEAGIPRDTERNRVALLVPLSGGNAGIGTSIANATQLALLDTNTTRVRITTYDTAKGAATAARQAIDEGAQLILGPLLAEDARAVGPIARAAGVPVLSFSNDTGVAGQGTYVMGYAPAQSITRVVEFARSRGVTSFAGLVPNGLYGERASTAFLRAVESGGGQVVSLQTFARAPGAISAAATRIAAKAPYDAVMIADGGATAAAAAPLAKRGSPGARLLGTELWNAEAGIAARPQLAGAWFASVSDGLYRQFATKYRARFGTGPYRLASLGYDAVLLTVRIARDWPVGTRFPEARLRDPGGFAGLDGALRFGRDGVADRALEVQEIRGGTAVTVSPAPTGFGR